MLRSITCLETVVIQLCDAINIVKLTESELSQVQGEVGNKVNAKLQSMLERNPGQGKVGNKVNTKLQSMLERNSGYSTLCKVADILCGNEAELGRNEQELSANN
jgi:hypothetical protein